MGQEGGDVRAEVPPSWLVRTVQGLQFSVTQDEETAARVAEGIGGTYEWYVPVQSRAYRTIGDTYDH